MNKETEKAFIKWAQTSTGKIFTKSIGKGKSYAIFSAGFSGGIDMFKKEAAKKCKI